MNELQTAPPESLEQVGRTTVRVRYAETDQMGVVYYANYLVWLELGRVELLRQLGFDYKQMELEDDCFIPVVEATCRYRAPARYDDVVTIDTEASLARGYLLKFRYRLWRAADETLLAEGETVHVVTGRDMKRKLLPMKYAEAIGRIGDGSDS
jgi:acyl-CoA thioester hydrolase